MRSNYFWTTFKCLHEFVKSTAAPVSKEDLVSLFVAVLIGDHQCLTSGVVTCLTDIERGNVNERQHSFQAEVVLLLQCTHTAQYVFIQE